MLKNPTDAPEIESSPALAAGSTPAMPMTSSAVMAALITQGAEERSRCAIALSQIVSGSSSTCGSRGVIAAAFDDLADLHDDSVGELLRGRTC
jgi:hypothetical protein